MKSDQILKLIEEKNFIAFEQDWSIIKENYSENNTQILLKEIIDRYYDENDFIFFSKVFDIIIEKSISLDYSIEHNAPSLLSLAVHFSSQKLFDYLLLKGANINFIADSCAFEPDKIAEPKVTNNLFARWDIKKRDEYNIERYSTCLDYAELNYDDMLSVDYTFTVSVLNEDISDWKSNNESFQITKSEYYKLIQQVKYLEDIIKTSNFIDYIKSLGGKTYEKLIKN
ncbi:MAG: hypothetical protein A2046_02525 [Bacteroidetes bacterium GWA2_30_7]|nr:MAG: hypothetical protein A2046_02525 [Bacteroidetes bacterium GWA2_30_7]